MLLETIRLHNGIKLPLIGFGTYKLKPGEETYQAVLEALTHGARHIDTSTMYRNEADVGRAIKDSQIPRDEIFITAKLPPHIKKKKAVRRFFERSLQTLDLEYIDAYIINAPGPFDDITGDYFEENIEAYSELEQLYKEELVTAIGVSQFQVHHLENIIQHCEIVPHINQISFFIGHTQEDIVTYCKEHDIAVQAFSPLAKGYLFNNPVVLELAMKYDRQPAQIALRYNLQKGVASIPKASSKQHIQQNTDLSFIIFEEDIHKLDQITDDPRQYDD